MNSTSPEPQAGPKRNWKILVAGVVAIAAIAALVFVLLTGLLPTKIGSEDLAGNGGESRAVLVQIPATSNSIGPWVCCQEGYDQKTNRYIQDNTVPKVLESTVGWSTSRSAQCAGLFGKSTYDGEFVTLKGVVLNTRETSASGNFFASIFDDQNRKMGIGGHDCYENQVFFSLAPHEMVAFQVVFPVGAGEGAFVQRAEFHQFTIYCNTCNGPSMPASLTYQAVAIGGTDVKMEFTNTDHKATKWAFVVSFLDANGKAVCSKVEHVDIPAGLSATTYVSCSANASQFFVSILGDDSSSRDKNH